ncbi:helix-turn-helix transcriptional regulator [Phyllobacterium sp. K27]
MKDPREAEVDGLDRNRKRRVCIGDFMDVEGLNLETSDDKLSLDDTLIEGQFLHRQLRHGMCIHGGDVMEERAFTATSVLREGLSCIFFLQGQVELNVGDRNFVFKGNRHCNLEGAAIMSVSEERFERISRERQHVRHLVVSVTPEWLEMDGGDVASGSLAQRLFKDHLAHGRWIPTPRLREVVRQVMAPSDMIPSLHNLFLEGRCVEIVAETVAALLNTDRAQQRPAALTKRELLRLQRAKEVIAKDIATPLTVEAISRAAGVSASGLQRLFRVSEEMSVFEYARKARLERAFAALRSDEASVNDASLLAGYSSPENFATAFRRQFGIRPRDVRKSMT